MNRLVENRWIESALRWLLGGMFIYAGVVKFISPQSFADSIATFRLLPPQGINLLALWLPVFEMTLAVSLVVNLAKKSALLGILLMTAVFAFALASAVARGLPVDCGCFGGHGPSVSQNWVSLGRDLLLGGVAFVLYRHALQKSLPARTTVIGPRVVASP